MKAATFLAKIGMRPCREGSRRLQWLQESLTEQQWMPIPKLVCLALLAALASTMASAPKAALERAADDVSNGLAQCAGKSRHAMQLAQVEIQIPSGAQLDRMEQQDIATPPLDVSGSPIAQGSEQSQIRRMDRQDRIIDDKVMRGICSDC